MALQEQGKILSKSISILRNLYFNDMALAGSDRRSGTRAPLPVPSVLTPHSPRRVLLHPRAPAPAGTKAAAAGAFGAAARLWRHSACRVSRSERQKEMQDLRPGVCYWKERNSEAHGVPVPVGCAQHPHRAPVQDSAPLALLRIPTGSRTSSSAWNGPSTAKLSCPRGTWNIVTKAPLYTHNHMLRRVTE